MSTDYSKWDTLYDSDEDRKKEEDLKKKEKAQEARMANAKARMERSMGVGADMGGAPPAAGPGGAAMSSAAMAQAGGLTPSSANDPSNMTQEQFLEQYQRAFAARKPKTPYKFPDTIEEQTEICNAANELRERGNALYKKGELVEAAKLYEQAVLKFADWYAECFATDEERKLVHAVKLPSHLNLAACSWRLGNYDHAVTHCTQVLEHDPKNVKALFRRGASNSKLGDLRQARADLKLASELAPGDAEIRKEIALLNVRMKEYKDKRWDMYRKGLAGAGAAEDDEGKGDEAGGEEGGEEGEGATGDEEGAEGDGEKDAEGSGGDDDAVVEGAPSEEAAGGSDAVQQVAGTLPPRRNVMGAERPPPMPPSASDAGGGGKETHQASNSFNPLIFLGIFGAIISIAGFFLMHYNGLISSAGDGP